MCGLEKQEVCGLVSTTESEKRGLTSVDLSPGELALTNRRLFPGFHSSRKGKLLWKLTGSLLLNFINVGLIQLLRFLGSFFGKTWVLSQLSSEPKEGSGKVLNRSGPVNLESQGSGL